MALAHYFEPLTLDMARAIAEEVAPHCAAGLNYARRIADATGWPGEDPAEVFRRDLENDVSEACADQARDAAERCED